jgi:hypothetical protein
VFSLFDEEGGTWLRENRVTTSRRLRRVAVGAVGVRGSRVQERVEMISHHLRLAVAGVDVVAGSHRVRRRVAMISRRLRRVAVEVGAVVVAGDLAEVAVSTPSFNVGSAS